MVGHAGEAALLTSGDVRLVVIGLVAVLGLSYVV